MPFTFPPEFRTKDEIYSGVRKMDIKISTLLWGKAEYGLNVWQQRASFLKNFVIFIRVYFIYTESFLIPPSEMNLQPSPQNLQASPTCHCVDRRPEWTLGAGSERGTEGRAEWQMFRFSPNLLPKKKREREKVKFYLLNIEPHLANSLIKGYLLCTKYRAG